jgi:integrase
MGRCRRQPVILFCRSSFARAISVALFRSTASTILNENEFMADVIERQLAHSERNKVRAAYNHAQYLPERRKMMQWWADYLDKAAKKSTKPKN